MGSAFGFSGRAEQTAHSTALAALPEHWQSFAAPPSTARLEWAFLCLSVRRLDACVGCTDAKSCRLWQLIGRWFTFISPMLYYSSMDHHITLLETVAEHPRSTASRLAEALGVSRQSASARLGRAVKEGFITKTGTGAGVRYALAVLEDVRESFDRDGLSEDRVWSSILSLVVASMPGNVRDIWQYGMTEMINNAIDHSRSTKVHIGMRRNALFTEAFVADDGEGIFLRIQKALGLFDPRESILELAKGKFTTDPANHSGEGIFFTSRVFDAFSIKSGRLLFAHDDGEMDVLVERSADAPGTIVQMRLNNASTRTTKEVFDKFAAPEEYTFAKTIVPVRLAQHEGEKLVSRSQAKRLTMRFERFQTVILDFAGVAEIGQAFADEVFRVFQASHTSTRLVPLHESQEVRAMIARAKAAYKAQTLS